MQLGENQLFDNRYRLLKQLGQGASAQVWLASDTTAANMYVAIKVLSARSGIDTYGMQNFRREFTSVYNVQHQNLLTPTNYAVCDDTPYLVLPYCDNGSVKGMVGRADENDVIKFLHDVAAGLACLHSHEIIHQDIKPDNILLDDDCNFLVTDFGISVGTTDNATGSYGGTRAYMGPERFGENPEAIKASDIWALGATAYEMITGDAPFGDNGGLVQTQGEEIPALPATMQPELKELINSCLNKDSWERPSAEDIRRKTARYLETGSWKEPNGKKYLYISIAATIALLVIAGAWIWDYNRTKVYYYKDYAEYWGVPKGIGVLTGSEMQHREQSYRFEFSKRKVQRVSLVNSVGNVIAHSDTEHTRSRYCDVRFFYSDNGSIDYKTIYDTNGKVLYKMDYDEKLKTVTFRQDDEYSTEFALDANTTKLLNQNASIFDDKSRISRYLLKHDEDGLLTEIRYVGLQNVPAGDSDNIYGQQYTYDSKGRKIEERFIGIDGSVKGNEFGLAIKEFEYDENDDWISVTYLNADRKASHDGNNCPLIKLENDEYGNRIKETYHTLDGTPSIRTDMSVHGFSYKRTENGLRIEQTCLGLNGQPGFSKNGFVTVKDEHDENGFITKRVFLDANGNKVRYIADGESYGEMHITNNEHGQALETTYYDEFGCPINLTIGISKFVFEYDSNGNQTLAKYFTNTGEPALYYGRYCEIKYIYDNFNRLVEQTTYDVNGEPTLDETGVASYKFSYNRNGALTKIEYFDTQSKAVLSSNRYAGFEIEYDEIGNRKTFRYIDTAGNPCMSTEGYASESYRYDEKTNFRIETTEYDASGKILWIYRSKYDDRGNITENYAIDSKGTLKPGFVVKKSEYNNDNKEVKSVAYDLKGNLINFNDVDYAQMIYKYDERGNCIETSYWDKYGKPAVDEQKTHIRIRNFDELNRVIYEKNLNMSGNPVSGTDVNPEGKVKYDRFGNMIEISCYDGYGKPRLSSDGFHVQKGEYNDRNQLVSSQYYDLSGNLVESKSNGYAKINYTYDDKGNNTETKVYDKNNKCTKIEKYKYNERNNLIEQSIHDGAGKLSDKAYGLARVVIEYDKEGVAPTIRKFYYANGSLVGTQKYDDKKQEWVTISTNSSNQSSSYGASSGANTNWMSTVRNAASECPVKIENGVYIQNVSYTSSSVTITFKLTEVSKYDISSDEIAQVKSNMQSYKSSLRSEFGLPASVSLTIKVIDKAGRNIFTT